MSTVYVVCPKQTESSDCVQDLIKGYGLFFGHEVLLCEDLNEATLIAETTNRKVMRLEINLK